MHQGPLRKSHMKDLALCVLHPLRTVQEIGLSLSRSLRMGTGNNVLMLGVQTEKVFEILFSGKSSLGTHELSTSHLFGIVENRNRRTGTYFPHPSYC